MHQALAQLHSASHFKSKYIVFRDTPKKKQNLFNNNHNNNKFRYTQNKKENKRKQNLFNNTQTTPNLNIHKTKQNKTKGK